MKRYTWAILYSLSILAQTPAIIADKWWGYFVAGYLTQALIRELLDLRYGRGKVV